MATKKVLPKKQPLRIAGKPAGAGGKTNAEATAEATIPKKVAPKKADKKEQTESAAKKSREKLAAKNKANDEAIAGSGYAIGDEAAMKSGRVVEITKITKRPNGVHLWWKTPSGDSAGGDYVQRMRGKMVDGVCVDPISGETVEMPEPKKAKKKAVAKVEAVEEASEEVEATEGEEQQEEE